MTILYIVEDVENNLIINLLNQIVIDENEIIKIYNLIIYYYYYTLL